MQVPGLLWGEPNGERSGEREPEARAQPLCGEALEVKRA